jgi:glyoxylase-like metal-dependent hydrolase (beta-lactamase superfamily II)
MAFLQRDDLQLDAILVTHRHADHMGAVGHTSGDIAYYGEEFDGVPLLFLRRPVVF